MRYLARLGQLGLLLLALLVSGAGCTRHFFRNRADQEVAALLGEKDRFPQWKIMNMWVYPDPRARFADPSKADRPPMPPDDPGAHLLAPNPQKPGHAGIKWIEGTSYLELLAKWDAENRAFKAAQEKAKDGDDAAEESDLVPLAPAAGERGRGRGEQDSEAINPLPVLDEPKGRLRVALQQPKGQPKPELLPSPRGEQRPETLPRPRFETAPDVPNPAYPPPATTDADTNAFILRGETCVKPFLLDVEQAILLSMINSREYQTRREDLYLAALPLTRERFSFAAQGFLSENYLRERTGALDKLGQGDPSIFQTSTGVGKLFSTGALLLFQFANETVLNLGGPNQGLSSVSTINLDFIQPLLRGGGRAVTLEPLTLAERNLLYNVRTFARFRKQYYQFITGGGNLPGVGGGTGVVNVSAATGAGGGAGTIGVNSSGNVGPSGLNIGGLGFSQVPASFPGFLGSLRPQVVPPSASGALFLSFTPSAPSEGVYSTILKAAVLDIGLQNVKRLEDALRLFEGFEQGGDVSKLQVDQVRLQLLSGRSTVLTNAQAYRDSLDSIKLQLGVPLTTQLELDDSLVRPVMKHMARFEEAITDFEVAAKQLDELDAADKLPQFRQGLLRILADSKLTRPTEKFKKEIPQAWLDFQKRYPDLKNLSDRLGALRDERRKLFDLKSELEAKEKSLSPPDLARLEAVDRELSVGELEQAVRRYEEAPWTKAPNPRIAADIRAGRWRDVRNAFTLVLGEASNERLDILRPLWPALPGVAIEGADLVNGDIEKAYEAVIKTAIEYRLDLMNARAQVHDTWRQIRVIANSLLGFFNVAYHMDAATAPAGSHVLAFIPEATRHQLILNFQAPLVRIQERNAFRASLIAFQRARRALMEAEDIIANQVRAEVRLLQVLAKNFKIQQQNVELSFLQVESSLETFRAPPPPGAQGNNAANAAALTNQVLQAYTKVLQAQQQLVNNWVSYITARQQLYLDTELMLIDPRGVWPDEFAESTNGLSHTVRADRSGAVAAGEAGPAAAGPPLGGAEAAPK